MNHSTTYVSTSYTPSETNVFEDTKLLFEGCGCPSFSQCDFTGKETDCETGYSYFGARYYDPTLLTSWTAVDPMADKYPSLSPYNYCAWNPMKLVDPNGKETIENDDGWIVDHDTKTVTHISDEGGNTNQYTCKPDGMFPLFYRNTSVADFRESFEKGGYRIQESPETNFGLGLAVSSMTLSATNSAVFIPTLDNTLMMQAKSKALGFGLDFSNELRVLDGLSTFLSKTGTALGSIGVGVSAIQLMTDNNIEDATFHFMDGTMGSIALIPGPQQPITAGMALGWSLFGRQTIKAQAESFITIQEMGWNPGHCMFDLYSNPSSANAVDCWSC